MPNVREAVWAMRTQPAMEDTVKKSLAYVRDWMTRNQNTHKRLETSPSFLREVILMHATDPEILSYVQDKEEVNRLIDARIKQMLDLQRRFAGVRSLAGGAF